MATPMKTALNENWAGVRMRSRWPRRPPAMPAKKAAMVKPIKRVRATFTPDICAAI